MTNIVNNLRKDIDKISDIRSLIFIKTNNQGFNFSKHLLNFNFIMGIDKFEDISSVIRKFNSGKNIIISKVKQLNENDIDHMIYTSLYDTNLLDIIFVQNYDLIKYLENIRDYEIIIDKDNVLFDGEEKSGEIKTKAIDSDDFLEECIDFYINLVRLAISYKELDFIRTNKLKNILTEKLINLINIYLGLKYNNSIQLDEYGYNIKKHLEDEYYDVLKELLEFRSIDEIWTFIFKSAVLYRKIGLTVSEKYSLHYPRKEDVETMEYLRNLYNSSALSQ